MTFKKENNFSNQSFCPEVYNQIQIDMQGDVRICCLASDGGVLKDSDEKTINVTTHSIIDAMNSNVHKQHRLELSQNVKPTRCSNCYSWEKHSDDSRRTKFIKFSDNILPDYTKASDAYTLTADDGSIDTTETKLVNLDIRFGNLCNLKCVMCDPGNSSLWADDWDVLSNSFTDFDDKGRSKRFVSGGVDPVTGNSQYWKSENKVYLLEKNLSGNLKIANKNWWETDSWKMQFEEISPQLRHIYFTGGEPLIVPAMSEHLDYLIDKGFSDKIRLVYDTNLTVINTAIIDKWKQFKYVELRVSVDETGERYNLVRNPGNFDKLKQNIKTLKDSGIPIQRITIVTSMANIYGCIRVAQFAKEMSIATSIRFVSRPGWISMQNLPLSAREEIIEKLNSFLQSSDSNSIQGCEHIVKAQIKHLNNMGNHPGDFEKIATFVHVMNVLDTTRDIKWREVIPDVVDLIQRHSKSIPGL